MTSSGFVGVKNYFRHAQQSPVQRIVLGISLWWASNGVVGYFISPSFSLHPMSMRTVHLWLVPITINAWHALFHFITGVAGLLLVRHRQSATVYAFIFAGLYETVGILGVLNGSCVLGLMAVDRFGSGVHMVEGVIVMTGGVFALLSKTRPTEPERRTQPESDTIDKAAESVTVAQPDYSFDRRAQ